MNVELTIVIFLILGVFIMGFSAGKLTCEDCPKTQIEEMK